MEAHTVLEDRKRWRRRKRPSRESRVWDRRSIQFLLQNPEG